MKTDIKTQMDAEKAEDVLTNLEAKHGLAPARCSASGPLLSETNKPLNCEVEGDQLVIRIGVSTLAWAAKKRNGGPVPDNYRMLDKHQWARDVENRIMHEDEIGNTILCDMLDEAMQQAMDDGSTALAYPKTPNAELKHAEPSGIDCK